MESPAALLSQYLHAIWRRRWLSIAVAWAVCLAGWAVVAFIPSRYESQARVFVDADGLLTPLLRGLAVDVDPAQQLDVLQKTLLSRSNIEQLIHMADLDARVRSAADKDALIAKLLDGIVIKPQTRNLFAISYQDTNPATARNVVQSLLTIFAESSTGTARTQMSNAQRFLNDQLAAYETQLRAAEKRRAEFREQHVEILSGAASTANIEAARAKLEQMRAELQDAQARRDALEKELTGLPATLSVDAGNAVIINNGNADAGSPQQRLTQAERQLADLRSRYTEQWPEIIALKGEIADLKKQVAGEPPGADPATGARRTQIANNVYEQVKIRLVETMSQVASLQRRVADADADMKRLDAIAHSSPGVEAQAQDLDRDYNILKKNYEELLARRESTNLAEAADTKADKIQFRVIDAPQLPTAAVAPKRPLLFSAVLAGGLLGGLALPILLLQLDRSYANLQRLRELGLPVLGAVSYVARAKSRGRALMDAATFGASAFGLVAIWGLLVLISLDLHRLLPGRAGG
jgi:polysaccharide chain length determinant protein (PEP-CTERM system associated)